MGRRRYTADFKRRVVVEAMRGDQTVQAITARHGINPNQLSRWKTEAYDGLLDLQSRVGTVLRVDLAGVVDLRPPVPPPKPILGGVRSGCLVVQPNAGLV